MNINHNCVPYRRKGLYLVLTLPMIALYLLIAAWLWQVNLLFFGIYLGLFLLVAVAQSYVCVFWGCPYVGKFAPCVGGFCLPSSQLARLLRGVKRSEKTYHIFVNLAFIAFLGIILTPLIFLWRLGWGYLFAYVGVVVLYAAGFLGWICPACATRQVCPGGQTSTKLRAWF